MSNCYRRVVCSSQIPDIRSPVRLTPGLRAEGLGGLPPGPQRLELAHRSAGSCRARRESARRLAATDSEPCRRVSLWLAGVCDRAQSRRALLVTSARGREGLARADSSEQPRQAEPLARAARESLSSTATLATASVVVVSVPTTQPVGITSAIAEATPRPEGSGEDAHGVRAVRVVGR